jgi:hypothetical protein
MPSLEDSAETQALLQFWRKELDGVGTLITEFRVSPARRRIDGVVIPGKKPDGNVIKGVDVMKGIEEGDLAGQDVILIEVKKRLGRFLAGQAFFAIGLVAPLKPASIKAIALCNKDDRDLRRLLKQHKVDVQMIDPWPSPKEPRRARRNLPA